MIRKLSLALFGALCAFSVACSGDGRTPLVLYSPHGRDLLSLIEKRYEQLHPKIDVRWLDMGAQEVYDRIRSEKANPQADVWYGGPQSTFAQGATDGLLAPFHPTWVSAITPESRRADDLYFGLYRTAPVLVYNDQAVSAADAPRDWDDLLAPRFAGKVLIRDPLASGTMRTLFGSILARSVAETGSEERGWQWLRRLDVQTKEYTSTPALLMEKLNRRESLVTVWELTDMLWQKKRGAPLGYAFPTSGTPVIDDSISLVVGARHSEEAMAFIEWVGSPEAQKLAAEQAFRLPARTDLPPEALPEWARDVLARLVPAKVDWNLMSAKSKEWMATWDRTVRSRGAQAPNVAPGASGG